jgi:hypothetical protein
MTEAKRTISPEQAHEMLKGHEANFERIRQAGAHDERRWDNEIALLQRRVAERFEEVDIGGGDRLAIRTCLSDEESEEFARLLAESEKGKNLQARATATYQLLALITANPKLTADFFKTNRSQYATTDVMGLLVGFLENKGEQQRQRVQRVKDITSFRPEREGTELR